jgi:hypothetical protein
MYKNSKTIFSKSMHGGVMDGFLEEGVMYGTYLHSAELFLVAWGKVKIPKQK